MKYLRRISLLLTLAVLLASLPVGCISAFAASKKNKEEDKGNFEYYIQVDQTNQITTVFRTADNVIVRQSLCSCGLNGSTVDGNFKLAKAENEMDRKKWYHFKGFNVYAKYPTRVYKGILFHSLTYNKNNEAGMSAKAVEEYGYAASHGCIRLLVEDAQWIQENCPVGTPCKIYHSGVKDEELRTRLFQEHYVLESGLSYNEFWGYSNEPGVVWRFSPAEDVKKLQRRLYELGYYSDEIDGDYDTDTSYAVIRAQRDAGFEVTGTVDGAFSELIYSADAPAAIGHDLSDGMHGPTVRLLQNNLTALGLYSGEIDGIYDKEVSDAVTVFQGIYGYDEDGIATTIQQEAIAYEVEKAEETCGDDFTTELVSETIEAVTIDAEVKIRLREKANEKSNPLATVEPGTRLLLIERGEEWSKVKYKNETGYMKNKYLVANDYYVYHLNCTGSDGSTYTIGRTLEQINDGVKAPKNAFESVYEELVQARKSELKAYLKELENSKPSKVGFAKVAADEQDTSVTATVDTGSEDVRLNLRSEPDTAAEILDELSTGTVVTVKLTNGDWSYVEYNGVEGYVLTGYLSTDSHIEQLGGIATQVYTTEGFAYVYQSPDKESPKIGYVMVGKDITAFNSENGFTYIQYGKKMENSGYVKTELIAAEQDMISVEDAGEDSDTTSRKMTVYAFVIDTVASANIYTEESETSSIKKTIPAGTKVKVVFADEDSDWCQVKYGSKTTGYMKNSDLRYDIEKA